MAMSTMATAEDGDVLERRAAIARLADDAPLGLFFEALAQSVADDGVIVAKHDAEIRHVRMSDAPRSARSA